MRKSFGQLTIWVNRVFEIGASLCLVVVIAAMAVQVFTRYVMNAAYIGTEELARFFFIWATMLGASICIRDGAHAVVSILSDCLRGKIKAWHLFLVDCLVIVLSLIMLYQGIQMVILTLPQLSPILRVSMGYVYLAIPVGSLGIILNTVNSMFLRFASEEKGEVS